MPEFRVETDDRLSVIDITDRVERALPVENGTATISSAHTTAGIAINEAEPRLLSDFADALESLVPDGGWRHDEIDNNADAHVRAMLVGASETVPVEDGSLALGSWQSVLFVECDGPRTRTVRVV